ncbi:cell division protein [Bifidobacterium fermentum]|uniref:Cell division protein n=1 Tax=Bifidobacterium fermentum TaxID=3059035 RepID=A0AB39UJR3_9BIFI
MTDNTENNDLHGSAMDDDTGESEVRSFAVSADGSVAPQAPQVPQAAGKSSDSTSPADQEDEPNHDSVEPSPMPRPAPASSSSAQRGESTKDPYAAYRRQSEVTNDEVADNEDADNEATGFVPAAAVNSASYADSKQNAQPLFSPDSLPDMSERHGGQSFDDGDEDSSHAEFTTVYDIIDAMQQSLDEAKAGLFTPGVVKIDKNEFSNSIVELKKMLPVQLERASALMRESERRLQNARTQANAIIASAQSRAADTVREAKEQAQFLAGQENVVAIAEQKAKVILDTARSKASTLSQGADRYSIRVMNDLDEQLNKIQQDVQAGLRVLDERQQKAQQQSQQSQQNQ